MSIPAQTRPMPSTPARINFGWIKEAWVLFSARWGLWIGTLALCFLLDGGVWVLLAIPTGVLASMQHSYAAANKSLLTHTPAVATADPYKNFAEWQLQSNLSECIVSILNGGLYRMALRQKRGEPVSVADLFSGFTQALSLIAVGAIVTVFLSLFNGVDLWLLHWSLTPAAAISAVDRVGLIPALVLPGLFMFAPLLIVDDGANVTDALLGSVRLLRSRWLMGIVFYAGVSLLTFMGAFLCGVGLLVTCPLFFLSITIGYLALTQPGAAAELPEFDPAPVGVWPPPPRVPEEKRL